MYDLFLIKVFTGDSRPHFVSDGFFPAGNNSDLASRFFNSLFGGLAELMSFDFERLGQFAETKDLQFVKVFLDDLRLLQNDR